MRAPEKRQRIYQRLVLLLCICCFLSASALFTGPWAVPKGSGCAGYADGNHDTCRTQGIFLEVGVLGSSFYVSSLSVYSLLAVLKDFQEARIRWIERWIHLTAFSFVSAVSVAFLALDFYEPSLLFCFVRNFSSIAQPNSTTSNRLKFFLNDFPRILMIILSVLTMVALHYIERGKIANNGGLCGKKRVLEDARRLKSKIVAQQTWLYLIIFWITHVSGLLAQQSMSLVSYTTSLALLVLFSSQGFLVGITYFSLQIRFKNKEKRLVAQRCSVSSLSLQHRVDIIHKVEAGEQEQSKAPKEDFIIYDGTNPNPSSRWAKFIINDEDDDDILSDESGDLDLIDDYALEKC